MRSEGETIDDAVRGTPRSPRPLLQIVLVLEGARPLAGAARWSLAGIDVVEIGRGPSRSARREKRNGVETLRIDVPSPSMSSVHARLIRSRESWVIEDGPSRNGTWMHGERVTRSPFELGEIFEIGHAFFTVREFLLEAGAAADLALESTERGAQATMVPELEARLAQLARIAPSTVPVLTIGETGTGKEIVARTSHELSKRSGRFVAVNCGALSESLLTSQLFGHVRGAFSGAIRDEKGLVRESDGGTLFLDEIGELPPASQATLLRVLQDGEVLPVGSTKTVRVDLRVVAATNRSLEEDVVAGRFRADLLARLSGYVIALPALRERREDIGLLVGALLRELAGDRAPSVTFTPQAGQALLAHSWPHNVRELKNVLARALALSSDGKIDLQHLPEGLGEAPKPTRRAVESDDDRLEGQLVELLRTHRGNVAAVARALGKAPMQIHRWMRRFGIDPADHRS
ncbi:MAG: sigma 54-interacting transcriptional regulator [Polyangiales bacterium]